MSTTKASLTKSGLHNMIVNAWGARIEAQRLVVEQEADEAHYLALVDEWRVKQQNRVKTLANRIRSGKIQDAELSDFMVPSAPARPDKWDRGRAGERLADLERRRDKALARFEALSWPASGEREFTEAQITTLFGA